MRRHPKLHRRPPLLGLPSLWDHDSAMNTHHSFRRRIVCAGAVSSFAAGIWWASDCCYVTFSSRDLTACIGGWIGQAQCLLQSPPYSPPTEKRGYLDAVVTCGFAH